MKTLKIETHAGDSIHAVAKRAKEIASEESFTDLAVEFDFNDIQCLVDKTTNTEWLVRDYLNAHRMEWTTIGPKCTFDYSSVMQAELERRNKLAEEKAAAQRLEWEAKDKAEQEAFESAVAGIEIELLDADGWNKAKSINSDGYGKAAIDYAEGWAKKMQIEIAKGKTVAECFKYTQDGLGFLGITGFQFGCAVSTLSQTWKHGAELRKAHNKSYGVESEEGTVNPAILTISK